MTVTMGGDHTIALAILRAVARRHGPVGLVHVDAHTDINDTMFGVLPGVEVRSPGDDAPGGSVR